MTNTGLSIQEPSLVPEPYVSPLERELRDIKNRVKILELDVVEELIGRIEALERIVRDGFLLDS